MDLDISEYIPLVIVFTIVFYSIFKKKPQKNYEKMAEPTLDRNKNEKVVSSQKLFSKPSSLENSLENNVLKSHSSTQKLVNCPKMDGIVDDFLKENIEEISTEEIRKSILFGEIFSRKKADEFI